MKKLFKILAWSLGTVVVLIVAAIVIVPMVVDPNDYKPQIEAAVKEATGRDLKIVGDIGLKVFPRVAVDLGEVSLGNAPGFTDAYFAKTENLQVRVKLMPLLDRQVEMDTIRIDGLDVNLARDQTGRTNWDDLVAAGATEGDTGTGDAAKGPPAVAALALGGVNLRDASLSWADAQGGQNVKVSQLALQTGPVSLDSPLDVSVSFNVQSATQELDGHVELAGRLAYDPTSQRAAGDDLTLNATLRGPQIPGGETDLNFKGDAVFDQSKQAFSLTGFELLVPKLNLGKTAGSVSVGGDLAGDLSSGRFTSDSLAVEGKLSGADLPGKELPFKLMTGMGLDLNAERLELPGLQFSAAELNGTGQLTATELFQTPKVQGELEVASFNPKALLAKLGMDTPETSDPKALTSLALSASLEASPNAVSLRPFNAKLDGSSIKGNLNIKDFSKLAVVLDLAVDALDADRYLPPSSTTPASPGAAAPAATGLPLDTLRGLDVEAALALGQLKVTGLKLDDIRATVKAKQGLISVSPLQAKLYGGTYNGSLALDARGEQAQIKLDEKLKGVRVGELLAAVNAETGTMDLSDAAGDLSLKSQVSGDPGKQTYALKDTVIEANVTGKALPGGKLVARASADVDADLAKGIVNGRNVQAGVVGLTLPNGLSATGTLAANSVKAALNAKQYSASEVTLDLKKLELGPKAPNMPTALTAKSLGADLQAQTASAEQFNLSTLGLKASGTVAVSGLDKTPEIAGQLRSASFNPKQVLKNLGQPAPQTADPNALTAVSLAGNFKATPNSVALDALELKLDDTAVKGELSIADLKAPNGIRFSLEAGSLNADRYLPPKSTAQAGTPGAAAAALPLELLRGLNANGTLKINQLILSNLTLTDINVKIAGDGGVLQINPASALLYGGAYAGNIKMDARGNKGKLSVDEKLERVNLGPLLKDLNGNDRLSGRGDLSLKAEALGATPDELKQTLTGNAAVTLKEGAVKGIDIVHTLCSGIASLLGGGRRGGDETKFSELGGTATITNGLLDNRDFVAKSPLLRVNGGGTYDIPRDQINYDVEASLVASCEGQGGLALAELGKLPPAGVTITGSAKAPKYKFDLSRMLAGIAKKGGGVEGLGELLGIEELKGVKLPGVGGAESGAQGTGTAQQPSQGQPAKKPEEEAVQQLLKGLLGGDTTQQQPAQETAPQQQQQQQQQQPVKKKSETEAVQDLLKGLFN